MATYLIGDIQGCYHDFLALLTKANFNPKKDTLYVAGDLVARGEDSLATLRYLYQLGESAKIVLGNHDLHLLAVDLGIKANKEKDKITSILTAPDKGELLEWLRRQPLLIHFKPKGLLKSFVMTHAGIPPCWTLTQAKQYAKEVESVLQSKGYLDLLKNMYSDEPRLWSNKLTGYARLRFIINAFTRMRFCEKDMGLDMACKLPPAELKSAKQEQTLVPWFEHPNRKPIKETLVFGHWAALGGLREENLIGLDTACVWGGALTMLRWDDGVYFQQACSLSAD